jgi:esterase/lipase superfamily enzyme
MKQYALEPGRPVSVGMFRLLLEADDQRAATGQIPQVDPLEVFVGRDMRGRAPGRGVPSPDETKMQGPGTATRRPPTIAIWPTELPPLPPPTPKRSALKPKPSIRGRGESYRVWYGTTRRRADANDLSQGYSAERDTVTHYGYCDVFVPESHKIGSVGSRWWKRLLSRTDDRLELRTLRQSTRAEHFATIRRHLNKVVIAERDAVVFVHGYNVSFHGAALRAAQIGFDLGIKGAMAFFSWPSKGTILGYAADEASVEASEEPLVQYLTDFATLTGAQHVHVIAHSMGNRAVLRAAHHIASDVSARTGVRFGHFVLAAPDVDTEVFRRLATVYAQVGRGATVYVSGRDRAVELSQWLHSFPRVGFAPPLTIVDGVETVHVMNADLTLLGHGYVAEARDVLVDIHAVLRGHVEAAKRFGLRQAFDGERAYWQIG